MGEIKLKSKIRKGRKKVKWSKTREGYNVTFEIKIYINLNKKNRK